MLLSKLKDSVNTETFWTFVKNCRLKSSHNSKKPNITPDEWFTHFRNLLNNDSNVETEFSLYIRNNNSLHDHMCDKVNLIV